MELDKRIKDISTIQTILQHDVNCIGCKGYFFDNFVQTKDLSKCRYGELIDITTHDDRNDLCFKAEYEEGLVGFYRFFISEDDLKPIEKKYRPYSLNEFLNKHKIGDEITYRLKLDKQPKNFIRRKDMICGYQIETGKADVPGEGLINLGGMCVSLLAMFNTYETPNNYLYPEVWQPFGVVDKEE